MMPSFWRSSSWLTRRRSCSPESVCNVMAGLAMGGRRPLVVQMLAAGPASRSAIQRALMLLDGRAASHWIPAEASCAMLICTS